MQAFEYLPHTADVGIKGYGRTLKEAFENTAVGMFSIITDLARVEERLSVDVSAEAQDREGLLVAWLNELLYRFEVDYTLFRRFEITEWDEEKQLKAKAFGEPVDPDKHEIQASIKAATYHMVQVIKNSAWSTQVIFDV